MTDTFRQIPAAALEEAAERIRSGGIVAFPTETFYGLAVDPFNSSALERLFLLKNRAPDKPVLVLIDKVESLDLLTDVISPEHKKLMDLFWPGPLTLVFQGLRGLPPLITDGAGTVGVRLSSHPVARKLASLSGGAITGTSANPANEPAAVSVSDIAEMFPDLLDHVVDGGEVEGGTGSSIVGFENGKLKFIREGKIPFEKIKNSVGP